MNVQISAFADEIDERLDVQMDVLEKHGIHFIEMRGVDGKNISEYSIEEAKEISSRLKTRGFQLSAIGSPIGKIGILEPFEPHLALFKHVLDLADVLEAPFIRMFSFFMPAGDEPSLYRDEVLRRWRAFLDAASGRNVILLHENEKDIYGDTAARCLDLLQSLQSEQLKATFDPANFVQVGEKTFPEAFEMLQPYIHYMHIKDAVFGSGEVKPAGEGDGKVGEILKALDANGWEGFLSLEPHLNNNLPGGGAELFGVAHAALMELL